MGAFRVSGEKGKNVLDGFGNLRICCEQTQIGIKPRGDRIVVTGPEMCVSPCDSIRISSYQQGELAMCLQPYQAMENLYTCIFQIARPPNVRGLIKTRL